MNMNVFVQLLVGFCLTVSCVAGYGELPRDGDTLLERFWERQDALNLSPTDRVQTFCALADVYLDYSCPEWWRANLIANLSNEVSEKRPRSTDWKVILPVGSKTVAIFDGMRKYSTHLAESSLRDFAYAKVFVKDDIAYIVDTGSHIGPNSVFCIAIATGEVKWTAQMSRFPRMDGGNYDHLTDLTIDKNRVVVIGWAQPCCYAFAIDARNGKLEWQFSWCINAGESDELFDPSQPSSAGKINQQRFGFGN